MGESQLSGQGSCTSRHFERCSNNGDWAKYPFGLRLPRAATIQEDRIKWESRVHGWHIKGPRFSPLHVQFKALR